jgi:hypothetical protein
MMNYEKRLINFLKANPNIRMTPKMIAGIWKRRHLDVAEAAVQLAAQSKLVYVGNYIKLNTMCDGIGGA